MSPDAIQAAAVRNRVNRLQQIERLKPRRHEARTKIDALRGAQEGTAQAQEALTLMRTLSHVLNFFPTPKKVIAQMLSFANVQDGHHVLEPSMGKGDIALALSIGVTVKGYELNYTLAEHCRKLGLDCTQADFLEIRPQWLFDRVLMNPPFCHGIDERHVRHAFQFLKSRGRLVSVVSTTTARKLEHWADFMEELEDAFKNSERSTGVRTALVIKDA